MTKAFKFLFYEPEKSIVLAQLRERLLKMMLLSSFLIGTVVYGFAFIPAYHKGLYSTIVIYGIMYAWCILITFVPRLPYRLRAIGLLGIYFILGCLNLFESGLNVDAGLIFITFIAMAILLMGLRAGVMELAVVSVTISIFGFVNTSENIKLPMGLPQSDPLLWIIGGIIFFLMGILMTYSLAIVVNGLEENLVKVTLMAGELEKTNTAVRLSEARYRTLVETSPGLVVLLDLKGNILMVNQAGLALFGYESQADVIGKNFMAFIHPNDQLRMTEAFQRTLAVGEPKEFESLALRKNNIPFFVEINAALVLDEAGIPQSVIGICRDITARKEAEQILRKAKDALAEKVVETTVQLEQTSGRLEELVRHAPTVVYSFRPADRAITYISDNVTALLGYETSAFTGDAHFWRNHLHPEDMERVSAQMVDPDNQDSSGFEFRFLKSDGTYCWLRGERRLLREVDGRPVEYVGTLSDITERKNSEETLRLSEARYRSLYESMMDAYVSTDMDGRIQHFNQAYERMLGYEPDELRKLTKMDLTPEKWYALEADIAEKQILPRGYSDVYEKEYIRKDGTVFPVELRNVLMRDEAGNPSGMWAVVRDISERKLNEQNLRESEGRYRELLDNSMQGVIVFQDMQIAYANQAVLDALGYTYAELKSFAPPDVLRRVHPGDRRMFQKKFHAQLESGSTPGQYSLRVIRKDGSIMWVEIRLVAMEFRGKPALMLTAIDVSEIKQAEAGLRESARTLRTIINASDALVFLLDTKGFLITSNDSFAQRMGIKPDAVAGTNVVDILPEEAVRARQIPFDQAIHSAKPITNVDLREGVWFENSYYPVLDESGKVTRVAIYARDITEQRRVTEALRASEEQYRKLAEASHDLIFIISRDDRIEYVNSIGANYLGQEPQQLVGQPRSHFFPDDTNLRQKYGIQQVLKTGEAISAENANKFPTRTVWLNTWLVPLKDSSGEVTSVLGVSRDITERRRSEEALKQARNQLEYRVAERTSELLQSQEKLRILAGQTITAQEEERRAISRELHDEAGQALITLKYDLAAIQSELPEAESLPRQRLSESMKIIDQTMLHIRSLAHSLRPPVLEIGGIHLSLQEYCREQTKRTQIPVYYQGEDIPGLPDEIGISLYRFVQEAMTNALKHARATQVKVRLQYKKGEISISVSDNGRGIDDKTQSDGLGLLGIRERLNLLNGKLEIHSQKGRGVKLVARVPWGGPGRA